MSEAWVTVARRDDLADADWEAAMLREADIAATVVEADDGTLEIRVEIENEKQAEAILAQIDDPPVEDLTNEEPGEAGPNYAALNSASPERQAAFGRAIIFGLMGWAIPPFSVLAILKLLRGYLRPEPMTFDDWYQMLWAVFTTSLGLAVWWSVFKHFF